MGYSHSARALVVFIIVAVMFSSTENVVAQTPLRISIDYIKDNTFPMIEAFVAVSDAQGQPVRGLNADSFTVSEDGQTVKQVKASEIENTEQPLAIVLLLDVSGSMGSSSKPSPLDKALEAASTFINQLAPQDQVAVITFADAPAMIQTLTTDKNAVRASLERLKPEGSQTTIYDAVIEAVNLLKGFSQRRIIVLVTDGKDTGKGLFDFDQMIAQAETWSTPIYPLGFGKNVNQDELTRMAKLSGGVAQFQPDSSQLQSSFSATLRLLREQYQLRFLSAFPADEKQHELLVTTIYQGTQLQAKRFYTGRRSQIEVSVPGYQAGDIVGGIENFQPTTDWQTPLKQLDIVVDDKPLASIHDAPFEYRWDTTQTEEEIPLGEHRFNFILTDIAGNTGTASLSLDVQAPIRVHITSPSAGETLNGSAMIQAEVTSLSDILLGSVKFAVDGQPIGKPLSSAPYNIKWNLLAVPAGRHIITVTASDANGLFTVSDEITVNVAVRSYGWLIALILLLTIVGVMLPLAMRRRKQIGLPRSIPLKPVQATLREVDGLTPNNSWTLGETEFRLGRKSDENDLQLKGLNASRKHAVIRFEKGHYVIYAVNLNNPIIINDEPILHQHVLQNGDMILLGETILRFEQQ